MAKKGGNEAELARADEQSRQQRIRQGTRRVNSIFDGGTIGDTSLAEGTAYDPNGSYFNADGSAWTPTAAPAGGGGGLFGLFGGGAPAGKSAADQFKEGVAQGTLFSGSKSVGGFGEDFFKGRRDAFLNYATPQLEDQFGDATKQLTFALARNGTLNSSVRADKSADLSKKYSLNKQQIADQALASETDSRNAVEDARSNLIASLNATGDVQGASNSAMARASALSKPAAFNPLTSLFSDFTSTLGNQAALERANYYSGGQTGARYNTGLFAPNSGAVQVR